MVGSGVRGLGGDVELSGQRAGNVADWGLWHSSGVGFIRGLNGRPVAVGRESNKEQNNGHARGTCARAIGVSDNGVG